MPAIDDTFGVSWDDIVSGQPAGPTAEKTQGISKSEQKTLTVTKAAMNDVQLEVANTILGQAIKDSAGPKATKAMVVAAIGESNMTPGAAEQVYGTHKGVFQSNQIPPNETATQAHYFLVGGRSFAAGGAIGAAKDHPDWTVGMIAGHVEVSGRNVTASDPFYDKWAGEADAIIEAYGGIGDFSESNSSDTVAVTYQFTRGSTDDPFEDSWDAAQRLAGEVTGWDLFAVGNRFYYFSEMRLIRQTPVATVDRADPDVCVSLRGTVDNTGNATSCTLTVFAGLFVFHAGEVIKITNAGPFSTGRWKGRWIISETAGSVYQPTVELTLALPKPKGIEPAHDTKAGKTASETGADGSASNAETVSGAIPGSPVPGIKPHSSTHDTDGLVGYPAYDYLSPAGTPCVAPVSGKIVKLSGKDPKLGGLPGGALGYSIYLTGGGKTYFMTHLDKVLVAVGDGVTQGQQIAEIADGPPSWSTPHVHMGVHVGGL